MLLFVITLDLSAKAHYGNEGGEDNEKEEDDDKQSIMTVMKYTFFKTNKQTNK